VIILLAVGFNLWLARRREGAVAPAAAIDTLAVPELAGGDR
jgi:hypothetical protein